MKGRDVLLPVSLSHICMLFNLVKMSSLSRLFPRKNKPILRHLPHNESTVKYTAYSRYYIFYGLDKGIMILSALLYYAEYFILLKHHYAIFLFIHSSLHSQALATTECFIIWITKNIEFSVWHLSLVISI